ncbi:toll/interleukin-1 receptor domain-containing protein [Brevibacterium sp. UCMA 11752]|uniref:toll/interleukin-1 receptor domain-containing protein n=1 Tax=Brevibacterium sp. UCMA 11752 TaxID=2745946 RepID=UPI001F350247|nr:toll/interleukin-1 receptor domain-containing protein [Brevibacterium sp. UCMA 11752]MCF2588521.1 toll/interleukin-1 receptor domain-containing protein [Brevibacterium sp. UCMA 11752]
MGADLFISYAWTSDKRREWVRLLAAQLKALGFDVLIDADVDYGDDLNGFMRRVGESRRVLLVTDRNYVERADTMPDSGVGKENRWIAEQYADHEAAWLSALFIDNHGCTLPAWLDGHMPKGFDFNHSPGSQQQFPGAEQIEDLWRWITGLAANRDSATPIATLRERATRLEQQDLRTNASKWRSPDLEGEAHFEYRDATHNTFTWGFGDAEFGLNVSGCGNDSVYVYQDGIKAVGVIQTEQTEDTGLAHHLTPGRAVTPRVGQSLVLMNEHGRLAVVDIIKVQREDTSGHEYVAPFVEFRWRVIESS